jgi:LAO/AO transport system kinase
MLQLAHPVPHIFHNHAHAQPYAIEDQSAVDAAPAIWAPPIVRTVATEGKGIEDLANAIGQHYAYLQRSGELAQRERARLQSELDWLLRETLVARWQARVPRVEYLCTLERLVQRDLSPWEAADILVREAGGDA